MKPKPFSGKSQMRQVIITWAQKEHQMSWKSSSGLKMNKLSIHASFKKIASDLPKVGFVTLHCHLSKHRIFTGALCKGNVICKRKLHVIFEYKYFDQVRTRILDKGINNPTRQHCQDDTSLSGCV